MMKIDPQTPAELLPLSWLLDTWRGYGVEGETSATIQDLRAVVRGEQIELVFADQSASPVPLPATKPSQALQTMQKNPASAPQAQFFLLGVTAQREVPEHLRQSPGEVQLILNIQENDASGKLLREWVGVAQGPRMQWQSLGGLAPAEKGVGRVRIFGLVNGALMWNESTFSAAEFSQAAALGKELAAEALEAGRSGYLERLGDE